MIERNKRKVDPLRLMAVQILREVNESSAFANELLAERLSAAGLQARDRAFVTAMVYGTLTVQPRLDYHLKERLGYRWADLDPWLAAILRSGLWQLIYSYSIPAHSAGDESVRLTRHLVGESSTALVNAVLRNFSRELPQLPKRLKGIDLCLGTELFGLFKKWYGDEVATAIALSFLEKRSELCLRINPLRTDRQKIENILTVAELPFKSGNYLETAIHVDPQANSIKSLPMFNKGFVSPQDEAAQLVGAISGVKADMRVLDLCSAPGGKCCDLAERMGDQGEIIAVDISAERLLRVQENADRLGLKSIKVQVGDASSLESIRELAENGLFDLVLLDVPCSGLGLLGRKPEIRLRMSYEQVGRFAAISGEILVNAAQLVKKDGTLIYSTCTLNPDENEKQIERFLSSEAGAEFVGANLLQELPEAILDIVRQDPLMLKQAENGQLLLRPDLFQCDGFFIAKLKRRKSD